MRIAETGACRGYAFLSFLSLASAQEAIVKIEVASASAEEDPELEEVGAGSVDASSPARWQLTAQLCEPRKNKPDKKKKEEALPDLRCRRKAYPGKAKHADSVTISDKRRPPDAHLR